MALQMQAFPVPLYGGLDLKVDPKFVATDKSLTAQNLRYPEVKRIEKRYGQSVLSNSVPVTSDFIQTGKALGSFQNELLAYDGTALYGYNLASSSWQSRGNITEVEVGVQNVTAGINSAVDVTAASNGTVEVYAWSDTNGNVYYSARDTLTNSFYQQNVLVGVGGAPQVILTDNFAYIFILNGSTLMVKRLLLNNLGGGIVNSTTLAVNVLAGTYPSAAAVRDGNNKTPVVAWVDSTGVIGYGVYTDTLTLVYTNSVGGGWAVGTQLCVGKEFGTLTSPSAFCAFISAVTPGTSTSVTVYATSPITGASATHTATPVPPFGAAYTIRKAAIEFFGADPDVGGTGNLVVVADAQVGSLINPKPFIFTASAPQFNIVTGAPVAMAVNSNYLFGLFLASCIAPRDEGFYWVASSPTTTLLAQTSQQPTYYMCGVTDTAPNPTILSRYYASQAWLGTGNPPQTSVLDDGSIFLGQPYRAVLRAEVGGTVFTNQYVLGTTLSFPEASGMQVVPFQGQALINCGLTYDYDGASLTENGFWEYPEGINTNTDSPGSTEQYQYFITYEWTNAIGNVTYSAPSYAVVIDTASPVGAGATNTLAVPYTTLTRKPNVKIGIYRTNTNSSSPAYKIGTIDNVYTGLGAINFVDTVTDLVASGGQRLYAPADASGEIENEPAPIFKYISASKTRVFGIPQDYPYQIWFSKPAAPGRPVEFSAAQFIPIETAGGSVTGLSVIDTQAVVFKTQRIYFLPGDGPNAAGQPFNAFPQSLQLISSTSGCIANASVLGTAEGLFFQSQVGMNQLNRSLSLDPNFGIMIQPLVQSLTLTGAQAVVPQNQLRWTSAEGTCLVYDYVVKRWSTYTNYDSVGYQPFNGTFARFRTDGRVWFEDTSTFLDNGTAVQMRIETAWLKPAQMAQGFAAVWYAEILGDYISGHNLVIETAYDYLDLPADTVTWDATTYGNFGFFGSGSPYGSDPYYGSSQATPIYSTAYQVRYASKRQVCESVKFTIYDTNTTGASCALNEITLQLGVIGGIKRVPTGQQV